MQENRSQKQPEYEAVDDDALKAIIRQKIEDGVDYLGSELSASRERALNYYYGRPYGDEVEGRSQVVSRDVADTVEWILPSLLRIFTSTDDFVRFEPVGPEDEEQAQQETAYTNHVISKENEGFRIFHDWFKDALLSKVGIVHWEWNTRPEKHYETYTGITEEELDLILAEDGDVEIVERTDYEDPIPREIYEQMMEEAGQNAQAQGLDPQAAIDELPTTVPIIDVRICRTEVKGREEVYVVPPEEFVIERGARSIVDSGFCSHRERWRISDLREAGYPEDMIQQIHDDDDEEGYNTEELARDLYADHDHAHDSETDEASRKVWVHRVYMRVDYDGDGHAELRRIVYAGGQIFENEPADDIPYADLCSVVMPHRFYGQSVADLVMDIQRIKSSLWRQLLDNVHLANNPMKEVVDGQVNLDDLLVSRVGGIVRTKQPGMIRELTTADMSGSALTAMEYADSVRENRTGITRYNQGLDADSLNKTATGVTAIMEQANQRIELIARIFAETGVKRMMRGIHADLIKNQDKAKVVRLTNEWHEINPSEWRERNDMTVTVGLGTGNRDKQLGHLMRIAELQAQALQGGLPIVTPDNVYKTGIKIAENAGFKNAEDFFTDPEVVAQQQANMPQAPDPVAQQLEMQTQLLQVQTQADIQKAQVQNQIKLEEARIKAQLEREKLDREEALKREEMAQDYELAIKKERMKLESQERIAAMQNQAGELDRLAGEALSRLGA